MQSRILFRKYFIILAGVFALNGLFSQSAQMRVASINPGDLTINEIMAKNTETASDEFGEFDDWVELYNNTSDTLDLSGLFISDNFTLPLKWEFPLGTLLPANSYLIVWCDLDTFQAGFHTNFKLTSVGERMILSYASGLIVDSLNFPALGADSSWHRCPNGVGPFSLSTAPTFNAVNCGGIHSDDPFANNSIQFFPNPLHNQMMVESIYPMKNIQIFDGLGFLVKDIQANGLFRNVVDVTLLPSGIYFLKVDEINCGRMVIQH